MGLCDRLILARYSLNAVECCVSALYLSQLFQLPLLKAASAAQVFVGQHNGSGALSKMGPCIWQMIWFSLLTTFITLPLSGSIGFFFFDNTSVQQEGTLYFQCLVYVNFLFPLGAALSSFYLGRGRTSLVLLASLASHAVNILLDFLFIFGIEGFIPPLGVMGAALASAIAQLFFCALLLLDFLRPAHRQLYATGSYAFNPGLFWKMMRIGLPSAGTKLLLFFPWIAITYLIVHKGGDYLAILAFGSTLYIFFSCINEGLSQALITLGAYIVGSSQVKEMWKLLRSASLFLSFWGGLLLIPFLLFPEGFIALFFKEPPSQALLHELHFSCIWLWLLFLTHGFSLIGAGLLTSYGDTLFHMGAAGALSWLTSFLPVYLFIGGGNAPPHSLFLIMATACLIQGLVYLWRLSRQKWMNTSLIQQHIADA